ncbi:MAG: DNA polymerase III subunit gamma/tau [Alphaproteobacteria bacterium]
MLEQENINTTATENSDDKNYRVLARKYRPNDFDTLIGQDVLVRTLSNALQVGRIAQAFMLTGVRGVGKTTTARIVAKALNCSNTDENGNPPVKPCGACKNCEDITEGRHIDVVEMDAASNTGIDDIREIIESTQYTPTMGRYKIYILDEVHMLSKNAFNGLLKTLEEPPAHVKFIFATTEIGKVPITILSRCQRFDLRRVSVGELYTHYSNITKAEGFDADEEAIQTIARLADGSVRDGLSILDQALALSKDNKITTDLVNSMLGLADRKAIYDLLKLLLAGESKDALQSINNLYDIGAQPIIVLQELLDICWSLSKFKINPSLLEDSAMPEIDRNAGAELSAKLSLPVITSTWQILNKGLGEMAQSENQLMALEMIAIRLMYAAELPTPSEIVKKLINSDEPALEQSSGANNQTQKQDETPQEPVEQTPVAQANETPQPSVQPEPVNDIPKSDFNLETPKAEDYQLPKTFEQVIEFIRKSRPVIGVKLKNEARPVSFESGVCVMQANLGRDDKASIYNLINDNFGDNLKIEFSEEQGGKTLREVEQAEQQEVEARAEDTHLVKEVKKVFPTAKITTINLVEDNDVK